MFHSETLAISFTTLCQCLESEDTLKAIDPFYLVSMPGEVKGRGQCVTCRGLHILPGQ